jgi:hypothetical protein
MFHGFSVAQKSPHYRTLIVGPDRTLDRNQARPARLVAMIDIRDYRATRQTGIRAMPMCNSRVIGSADAERFCQAFARTLKSLNLVDRDDPLCDFIARTIIEIDAAGIHDPKEIAKIAVRRLNR